MLLSRKRWRGGSLVSMVVVSVSWSRAEFGASKDLADLAPELWPALARLSAQQRTIVLLVHGYGWSQADVAALLQINPSTVREHMNRALTRLRRELVVS